jgi:hypothetical protein
MIAAESEVRRIPIMFPDLQAKPQQAARMAGGIPRLTAKEATGRQPMK